LAGVPLPATATAGWNAFPFLIDGEAITCAETGLAQFEVLRSRHGDASELSTFMRWTDATCAWSR
jgi:ATP-dependent DNA ligase